MLLLPPVPCSQGPCPERSQKTRRADPLRPDWNGCQASQRYITVKSKETVTIGGFQYQPRTGNRNGDNNGRVGDYRISVSMDGRNWTEVASGHWNDDDTLKTVTFTPVKANCVRLEGVSTYGSKKNKFMSAAEIAVLVEQ